MSTHASQDAEVIVVGGGPAGSTTAALLAEGGRRVLLLDKARFPRHKACSDYVNPAATRLLAAFGLQRELDALGAHRLGAMRIHAPGGERVVVDFEAAAAGAHVTGLSRYRLDALLLDRARAAGVAVLEGAHVREVVVADGTVRGVTATFGERRETLLAPLTIGADGRNGVVCRALGLATVPRWPRRTGLVAHFRGVEGIDRWGEMHVGRHGYVGLAPVEGGLVNVAVVADSAAVAGRAGPLDAFVTAHLTEMPRVAARLRGAERVGGIRGVGPMAHRARRVAGNGFLLVGDAAGFLDPFTGQGIHEALLSATLAAPVAAAALRARDPSAARLAPYPAARRRAFRATHEVAWLVQGFVAAPPLMDYVTARLARRPDLAITLAGVLGGLAPAELALTPAYLGQLLRL